MIFMNSLCKACGESWEAGGIRRNPEDGDGDGDGDDVDAHEEHAERAFGVHKVRVFAH